MSKKRSKVQKKRKTTDTRQEFREAWGEAMRGETMTWEDFKIELNAYEDKCEHVWVEISGFPKIQRCLYCPQNRYLD